MINKKWSNRKNIASQSWEKYLSMSYSKLLQPQVCAATPEGSSFNFKRKSLSVLRNFTGLTVISKISHWCNQAIRPPNVEIFGKKNSWALSNEFTLYYQERFDLATSLLENPDRIFVLWICLAWVVISCATFKSENRGDKSNLARVVTQKFSLFLDFQIFVVWTSAVSWNRTEREKNTIHGKRFLHKRSVLV